LAVRNEIAADFTPLVMESHKVSFKMLKYPARKCPFLGTSAAHAVS
jgi:hypothetical protein